MVSAPGDRRFRAELESAWNRFSQQLDARDRSVLAALLVNALDPLTRAFHEENPLSEEERGTVDRLHAELPRPDPEVAPIGPHLGLIMKITRNCNLRCRYCHDWWNGPGSRMSFEVMAHAIAKSLRRTVPGPVQFMWHGGETLLVRPEVYRKIVRLQSEFRQPGQQIGNAIQTNATLLTPAWAAFLKQQEFSVSVSLDGPRAIHDAVRIDARGRPTYDQVLRGIEVLRDAGVPFSVLMVVDETTLERGAAYLIDFLEDIAVKDVGLIAVKPSNDLDQGVPESDSPAHYLAPERFNRFLCEVYDECYIRRDTPVRVRELDSLRQRIERAEATTCTLAGHCIGRYFSIEPTGDVAHCDLYVGDPDYTVGNIVTTDFDRLDHSPALCRMRRRSSVELDRLQHCAEFQTCNGGCPHDRYLAKRHGPAETGHCCGMDALIGHIRGHVATNACRPEPQNPNRTEHKA